MSGNDINKKWDKKKQKTEVAGAALEFVTAADVKPEKIEWLWNRRLAKGKITLIVGDPGVGKSTAALDIAACVSTGRPFANCDDESHEPRDVLIFSGEDGVADTLVPRLIAANADLKRIQIQRIDQENSVPLSLPRDVAPLEKAITDFKAGLVIIDPLLGYLDSNININNDAEVRQALMPLAMVVQRTGVSVIGIMHKNKGGGTQAIYRTGGSIAFGGVARLVLLADKDPNNEQSFVLAQTKNNLSPYAKSLLYAIGTAPNDVGQILWGGESPLSANDLLQAEAERNRNKPGSKPVKREAAEGFLEEFLANGPRKKTEILKAAKLAGIAESTLDRASAGMGIAKKPMEGVNWRERLWSLRPPPDDDPSTTFDTL